MNESQINPFRSIFEQTSLVKDDSYPIANKPRERTLTDHTSKIDSDLAECYYDI